MIQTPHLFSHQQHYGHNEQASWGPHSQQQSHQGLSHAQQHAQAQAAQAAAVAVQQQQYSRIAVNQNHSNHSQSNARDNRQSSGDSMNNAVNSMTEQGSPGMGMGDISEENRKVLQWVAELMDPARREGALMELSKKREQVPELALVLWHSFGVMTSLLQEIISVYPLLNPSQLTATASNRVCNALALLQCVASHNETRGLFLSGLSGPFQRWLVSSLTRRTAHIPLFLYPFLNTTSKSRPFEYLRLTSLGVIGALVKNEPSSTSGLKPSGTPGNQGNTNSSPTITFLLTTEIIPLCLRIMETGSELSKTVAIFIVQKILLDDTGLGYICATYERFYAVGTVLSNMVGGLVEVQTVRLLKHVVRCFLR
jgi:CCR4-NOT transcription complex subunit 9